MAGKRKTASPLGRKGLSRAVLNFAALHSLDVKPRKYSERFVSGDWYYVSKNGRHLGIVTRETTDEALLVQLQQMFEVYRP